MVTESKALSDEALLADVLSSPKNVELLKKNKVLTVGDAKKLTLQDIIKMGVGEVTIEEIRTLGVRQEAVIKDARIEESMNPIHIQSPFSRYCLQVLPGDVRRNPNGRGQQIVRPIYIVCQDGRGMLTAKMWYARKYERDMRRVQDAEVNKEPWRIEAYNWLKERKSYRRDFRVLSD